MAVDSANPPGDQPQQPVNILICPGVHDPTFTQQFVAGLCPDLSHTSPHSDLSRNFLIFPAQEYPAYSPWHVWQFLHQHLLGLPSHPRLEGINHPRRDTQMAPVLFLGFSAGVVGAIGAAWAWHQSGGTVAAVIALDGWGVPLGGPFPIHRISHDAFTHWSSALLGGGEAAGFYADPSVEHLELWRSPHTISGTLTNPTPSNSQDPIAFPAGAMTVAMFIRALLKHYGEWQAHP